ncbi:hypothetical protein [Streptomyces sp. NPDC053048]|uniref:hypothetical protein n=1 Tax=Streptomyces sp. NPDC053048 TaxID=3365694 RepID=UPI0037D4FDC0
MKATLSKDGRYRFDLRVTHRVGLGEMTQILAAIHGDYGDVDLGPLPERLSRTAIATEVRQYLAEYGWARLDGWADHLDYEGQVAVETWAKSVVEAAFPELKEDQ